MAAPRCTNSLLKALGQNPLHEPVQSKYQQNSKNQTGRDENDGFAMLEIMFINLALLHTNDGTEHTDQQAKKSVPARRLVGFIGCHG
jgi:hypothetical protein